MTDGQKFAATIQALLALLLIGAVTIVVFALLGIEAALLFKKIGESQQLTALLNTGFNALINMGAIGVGFWLARHRPQQANGADSEDNSPNPTQPPAPPASSTK